MRNDSEPLRVIELTPLTEVETCSFRAGFPLFHVLGRVIPPLQDLVALVLAAAYFATARLGDRVKLTVQSRHVTRLAKRFFRSPRFSLLCALADGIATLLSRAAKGPLLRSPPVVREPGQNWLFQLQ